MIDSVISTQQLCYRYSKNVQTLVDINLDVKRGCIYGFLGPNGSGKTTTLSLLLGLIKNQQGSIQIFGRDFASHRNNILRRIGALIESPSLYGHLTAKENLNIYKDVYRVTDDRIHQVLQLAGLSSTGNKLAKRFSLGMKQRLSLALALLPRPELLILDEPTNGLDPSGIIELREVIKKLNREEGITILVSSHILAEIEKMVSHVGIISKGKMLFQGPLAELHQLQQSGSSLLVSTSDNVTAMQLLSEYKPSLAYGNLCIFINSKMQVAEISRQLVNNNIDVYMLQPKKNDLEQLFIELTSDGL